MENQTNIVRVACFSAKEYDEHFIQEAAALPEFADVKFSFDFFSDRLSASTAILAKNHEAVCLYLNDEVNVEVANLLHELGVRVIALRSRSYNYINLNALAGRISVVHISDYNSHAIAEFSIALLQALNRKIYKSYARSREGNFSLDGLVGGDIYGKTVGIIGVGKVGKNVAEIYKGFGAKVLLNDMNQDDVFAQKVGANYVNLEELFKQADYISLHCPLTQETRHIINSSSLSLMKNDVEIVNTCREELFDPKVVCDALISGRIRGVAVDVFREYDHNSYRNLDENSVLDENVTKISQLPNVVLTYHQAYLTENNYRDMMKTTLKNIVAILNGEETPDEVSAVPKN